VLTAVRSHPCALAGNQLQPLTCSIGWSVFEWRPRQDGASPWESALAAADAALYVAKRDGRDCARRLLPDEAPSAGDLSAGEAPAPPATAAAPASAAVAA
jgi:hypothetical protein